MTNECVIDAPSHVHNHIRMFSMGIRDFFRPCTKTGMAEAGGRGGRMYAHPDFGRIEGATGQRRRVAFFFADPDFQTLRHP